MLDENVLAVDIDADHWKRLVDLLSPSLSERPTILLLIVEEGVCLKAIHSVIGAIRRFDYGIGDLEEIRSRTQVDYVARVGRDFFQEAFAAGQRPVRFDDDYVKQLADLYNGVIGYTGENLHWYPERPIAVRPIRYDKIQKTFNKLMPDGRILLFCVVDQGMPYTSLILGKRTGDISLITTFDAVAQTDEPFDPDEELDDAIELVETNFEKVFMAVVIEKSALEELRAGRRPLTYLKAALKHGRAWIKPMPFKVRFAMWYLRNFKGM